MKTIILIILLGLCTLNAQSILTVSAGAALELENGADICADSIDGSGTILGGGTFCGSPTGFESEEGISLPTEYALLQNYPNPFNPSTKILYAVPLSGRDESLFASGGGGLISLKVYDVLGNEVTTLVNEEKPAGKYEVEFDASHLSSGVYFYRLQTGSFIQAMKMILLR